MYGSKLTNLHRNIIFMRRTYFYTMVSDTGYFLLIEINLKHLKTTVKLYFKKYDFNIQSFKKALASEDNNNVLSDRPTE